MVVMGLGVDTLGVDEEGSGSPATVFGLVP